MSDDTVWQPSYHEETTDVREPRHSADTVDDLPMIGNFGGEPPTDLAIREPAALDVDPADTVEVHDAGAVDLFHDPFQDDLGAKLAAAGPRRLANRVTIVFAALVIAVAGFIAGAQVQKSYGTSSAAPGTGRGAGNFPTALPSGFTFNRGGGAGGAGAGGGRISGTVKLVDGTTVYVEESDGTVITVKTSDTTTVLAPGALKDLAAGATVTVQGQNDNGTVTATSITKTK